MAVRTTFTVEHPGTPGVKDHPEQWELTREEAETLHQELGEALGYVPIPDYQFNHPEQSSDGETWTAQVDIPQLLDVEAKLAAQQVTGHVMQPGSGFGVLPTGE